MRLYFIYPSDEEDLEQADGQVWLFQQDGALEELLNEVGEENCSYYEMPLSDEEVVDSWYCRMNQRVNQIDLDALRNGQLVWWNAM